jgi:hypothetical protein
MLGRIGGAPILIGMAAIAELGFRRFRHPLASLPVVAKMVSLATI